MTLTAPIRNGLVAVIALCLLGGLIGAFTVDGNSGPSVNVSAGATSTTAVGNGGDAGGPDPTTSVASGSEPATTAAPPTETTAPGKRKAAAITSTTAGGATATTAAPVDLGPPQDPGPATPPKAGTYKYTFSTKDSKNDATSKVEDKGTSGSETRQRVTSTGSGITQTTDIAWKPDGVFVLKTTFSFGDKSGDCDWEPDTLQLKLPITKGASWKADSTCTVSGLGPTPFTVTRHLEASFGELQRVKVGDEVVDVWSIPGKEHVEFAGTTVDSTSVTLFSPKYGLTVKQTSHTKATSPNGTDEGDSTLELLSTTPA